MNVRATVFSLLALTLAAYAAPNPSPIDAGTANVIAVNDNLACSSGSCNSSITESDVTNSTSNMYSSAASSSPLYGTFSPFTFLAVGGLAFSTGML